MEHIGDQDHHGHEKGQGVALNAVIRHKLLVVEEQSDDARAVERRQRNKVEKHQIQVHQREHGKEQRVEIKERLAFGRKLGGERVQDPRDHAREHRHGEIGSGAGKPHDRLACAAILEIRRVVRNRLRIAEDGPSQGKKQKRHENRAERVDVPERIETEAAAVFRRGVSQFRGREAVGGLVEHDGGNEAENRTNKVRK